MDNKDIDPTIVDTQEEDLSVQTRRSFVVHAGLAAGGIAALGAGLASTPAQAAAAEGKKVAATVPLNWKEVFYTNCPLISASNVDQELGWTGEEYRKIGVDFSYFRSRRGNNWYPHYVHNLDNLIRFGGLYPPIHVQAAAGDPAVRGEGGRHLHPEQGLPAYSGSDRQDESH